jgi:hypothetical protein
MCGEFGTHAASAFEVRKEGFGEDPERKTTRGAQDAPRASRLTLHWTNGLDVSSGCSTSALIGFGLARLQLGVTARVIRFSALNGMALGRRDSDGAPVAPYWLFRIDSCGFAFK